jgi:hypothetical protein
LNSLFREKEKEYKKQIEIMIKDLEREEEIKDNQVLEINHGISKLNTIKNLSGVKELIAQLMSKNSHC